MPYSLDTSALVKLYVREAGTAAMLRLMEQLPAGEVLVSAISGVEFASAVSRLERSGRMEGAAAAGLLSRFRAHWSWRYIQQAVTNAVLDRAMELVGRHALRAYDAVQLASCLMASGGQGVAGMRFVCSDRALLLAAGAEELECIDPQIQE